MIPGFLQPAGPTAPSRVWDALTGAQLTILSIANPLATPMPLAARIPSRIG